MGLGEWLNRVLGIGYGEEVVPCPRCGGNVFVRKLLQVGRQAVDCPYCRAAFHLVIHPGKGPHTEIIGDAVAPR